MDKPQVFTHLNSIRALAKKYKKEYGNNAPVKAFLDELLTGLDKLSEIHIAYITSDPNRLASYEVFHAYRLWIQTKSESLSEEWYKEENSHTRLHFTALSKAVSTLSPILENSTWAHVPYGKDKEENFRFSKYPTPVFTNDADIRYICDKIEFISDDVARLTMFKSTTDQVAEVTFDKNKPDRIEGSYDGLPFTFIRKP